MSRRLERAGRPAWDREADIMMEKTDQGLGRLCDIGDPVEHSKSPLIQNAMIAKLGIPYHYTKRLVHQGDTQEWLDTARREGFAGFNATMPHKVALVPLMDELGEDARLYGAVNTVCIRGKRCIGHNTDGMGFYQALTDLGVEVPGRRITLLGAGGAAKAVALKLVQQGAGPITVCNRTPQKAEALCNLAKGRMGHIGFALEDLRRGARDCDILINCTSLGMTGTNSQFRDLSFLDELPGHAAVFDLIYSPAETELLRQARLRGLKAANGLGMLIYQAVFALEYFAGVRIDAKEMEQHVIEACGLGGEA